jgi:hypothetical protein
MEGVDTFAPNGPRVVSFAPRTIRYTVRNRFYDPTPAYSGSLRPIPAKLYTNRQLWLE